MSKYVTLFSRIGYEFKDQTLIKMALTHKSYSKENNERLEFLGDIVLSLIISDVLYKLPKCFDEGELSSCRAYLIRGETLKELAIELKIGEYLLIGINEEKHKLRSQDTIYANAIEAIIGAIYLDSDIDICKKAIISWYGTRIDEICPEYAKDSKTRLQEYAQARAYSLPEYSIIEISGHEHEQTFKMSCRIQGLKEYSEGVGRSKRKAEQDAARKFLQIIKNE